MTREDIKTINDIVHKTIYGFFDICGDKETPMMDKDKLLLEVNKAVCNNIKDLEQEPCDDAISRQAALDEIISRLGISGEKYLLESERYIYQIIKDLPSVNPQEPCEDVISRQAALKIIDGWYDNNRDTENIEDLIILITYMASVNPQSKTGYWIESRCDMYECSECDHIYTDLSGERYEMHYCPNCGAKMVEPQESEDKE